MSKVYLHINGMDINDVYTIEVNNTFNTIDSQTDYVQIEGELPAPYKIFKIEGDNDVFVHQGVAKIFNEEEKSQIISLIYKDGEFENNNLPSHKFTITNNSNNIYILINPDINILYDIKPNSTKIYTPEFLLSTVDNKYYIIEADNYCSCDSNLLKTRSIKMFENINRYVKSDIKYTIECVEDRECGEDDDKSFWGKPGGIVLIIFFILISIVFLYYLFTSKNEREFLSY